MLSWRWSRAACRCRWYARSTGNIAVSYTPACNASDHSIRYGPLALVRFYNYSGSACDLGSSGAATFNPGTGSYFFVIAGNDGNLEGSYGVDGHDAERPAETDPSACTLPQNVNATCD